ncbi:MAG: hypothetical protein LBQ61_03265, partial [Spirochaetales bacterium]|nr:hypothetical protein [Spirochaetales bacterium]
MIRKTAATVGVLLFLLLPVSASPETLPLPEEEAPAALFSPGRDSPDVELFLQGSWKAQATASLGFAYVFGRGFYREESFPGMATGFDFVQHPDLTLSLWLFRRFYIETFFAEDWEDTRFVIGYRGRPGDFFQSAQGGNRQVEMENYSLLGFPEIPENGLGLAARFAGGFSEHEFLLRFDPAESLVVYFQGDARLSQVFLNPAGYRRGRDFILPKMPGTVIGNLVVLVEKTKDDPYPSVAAPDGRHYRRASQEDYRWDGSLG